MGALITEVSTAFISSPGGVQSPIVGQDVEGDHLKLVKYIHQYVKDFIVAVLTQTESKI